MPRKPISKRRVAVTCGICHRRFSAASYPALAPALSRHRVRYHPTVKGLIRYQVEKVVSASIWK